MNLKTTSRTGRAWRLLLPATMLWLLTVCTASAQNPAVNMDQLRNGTVTDDPIVPIWVNGNVNATQAHMVEGYSVPYRALLTNLTNGVSYTFEIEWDTRHSGANAIDYITHYDRLQPHITQWGHPQETVDPLEGMTGFNALVFDLYPIPAPGLTNAVSVDPDGAGPKPAALQPTSSSNALPASERVLTMWGGDITNFQYLCEQPLTGAQTSTRARITFTANGNKALMAWGGHIAKASDWGAGNSAGGIDGSPYHMRSKGLCTGTAFSTVLCSATPVSSYCNDGGNQDLQLAAKAVKPLECHINGDSIACSGDVLLLCSEFTSPDYAYAWEILASSPNTANAALIDPTNDSCVSASYEQNGTFVLQITISAGDESSSCSVPVVVNGLDVDILSANGAFVCQGAVAVFDVAPSGGSGDYSYEWTGPGITPDNVNDPSITITDEYPGVYCVTIIDNISGCSTDTCFAVAVLIPFCDVNGDSVICNGETTVLTEVGNGGNGSGYTWTPNTGIIDGQGTTSITVQPTESITYTVTFLDPNGCEASCEFPVTVNQPTESTTNAEVCAADLPYVWNGNEFGEAGTYEITLENAAGCDSIATLILVVNEATSSTTDVTVCDTELPYSWNDNLYAEAGTFEVTLTNANGCDSVATLVLVVNETTTSTTDVTICNDELPYVWNGNEYNESGAYDVTLTNATGCDSIATLVLVVNEVTYSTTEVTVCNNTLPYEWNGNSYDEAGSYQVTLTNADGCDSIATLVLVVNEVTESTTDVTICNDELPYVWNGNEYTESGSYEVTLTNAENCDSIATLVLVVNEVTYSTTDVTVCENGLPYEWNGNSYTEAGSYEVTLTNADGCDSIATLVLQVDDVTESTTDVTICNDELPYVWNGNEYNESGSYQVTLTNADNCDSIATLVLVVNEVTYSSTDVTICNDVLPYEWNGNSYTESGSYQVTLTNADGCDSIATLVLVVNEVTESTTDVTICNDELPYVWNGNEYNESGSYQVTLTNAENCDSIATLVLVVNEVTYSTTDVTVCNSSLPYEWNGNSYNEAGSYQVTLTNADGCDSIATLVLVVNEVTESTTDVTICNNELPYEWNGNSYTEAGTYQVTLTNADNCDSIATLVLVVNEVTESTTDAATCDNQLPYVWNGNEYTESGSYQVTLTNAAGCDSIATLVLVVNEVTESTTDVTICDSELPYAWNGNSYSEAGSYQVTLTNADNCDSIATLVLVVNETTYSTTDVTVCETELPYEWNGNSYNEAGSFQVTLENANGCDSIATLVLVVNETTESTTEEAVCADALPFVWNGNEYNESGSYQVTLTNAAGCDSIATLVLDVNENPTCLLEAPETLPSAGSSGNSLCVTTDIGDTYAWTVTSDDNSWSIDVDGAACASYTAGTAGSTGTFTVVVTSADGCTSTCEVSFEAIGSEFCTRTQGYYGGKKGKTCNGNNPVQNIAAALSSGSITIGSGTRKIVIGTTEAICVNSKLPAGGTPAVLPSSAVTISCGTAIGPNYLNGTKFKSVIWGQAITLSLNLRLDPNLGNLELDGPYMTTFAADSCVNGSAIPGTAQVFYIPQSVLTYLGANNTVNDLLALANLAIGGTAGLPSLSDINKALDAMNRGFDECRILGGFSDSMPVLRADQTENVTISGLTMSSYPNPFANSTTVSFQLDVDAVVTVNVYDVTGKVIATLYNGGVNANETYDVVFDASSLAQGMYLCKLSTSDASVTHKLVLIK